MMDMLDLQEALILISEVFVSCSKCDFNQCNYKFINLPSAYNHLSIFFFQFQAHGMDSLSIPLTLDCPRDDCEKEKPRRKRSHYGVCRLTFFSSPQLLNTAQVSRSVLVRVTAAREAQILLPQLLTRAERRIYSGEDV